MLNGRTIGQFIILLDSTPPVVNGGRNATAGYYNAQATGQTSCFNLVPHGKSLGTIATGQSEHVIERKHDEPSFSL